MSGKLFIASMMLLASTAAYASPGDWTRETRQVGNKVSIDVYHRTPYALTGKVAEPARRSSSEWTRETRQLGNKVSIDVYSR